LPPPTTTIFFAREVVLVVSAVVSVLSPVLALVVAIARRRGVRSDASRCAKANNTLREEESDAER
jgi:hypothetical protein